MYQDWNYKITIFDLDDCIVYSSAKALIKDKLTGKIIKELTSAEFTNLQLKDNEELDLNQFNEIDYLIKGSINTKIVNIFREDYNNNKPIAIITARADSILVKTYLNTLGFDIPFDMIYAVGNIKYNGNTALKKKQAFIELIDKGYKEFIYYDDDIRNLDEVKKLESKFNIKIEVFHVKNETN